MRRINLHPYFASRPHQPPRSSVKDLSNNIQSIITPIKSHVILVAKNLRLQPGHVLRGNVGWIADQKVERTLFPTIKKMILCDATMENCQTIGEALLISIFPCELNSMVAQVDSYSSRFLPFLDERENDGTRSRSYLEDPRRWTSSFVVLDEKVNQLLCLGTRN
mmetsp:Transcript_17541/g.40485  ORF Transcript_17541/g.40485 Transcript_17541/m.40485 type:complete len:164 (+) Transcript_17541:200-691(+)